MNGKKSNPTLDGIGARIRSLRQSRGMTQSELAGGDVTRNMLSRIEHGAALPSLPTLCAIASRLNIPVGALLGDLDTYLEYEAQEKIRALMRDEKYEKVIRYCDESEQVSGFVGVRALFAKAAICRARELYREGELTEARELLVRARDAGGDADEIHVLTELISACRAVEGEMCDDGAERLRALVFDKNDTAIYLFALSRLGDIAARPYSQPSEHAAPLIAELSPMINALSDGFYKAHIEAKFEMLRAEYLSAKTKLLTLLTPDTPPPLLWTVYTDLEFCCKCCGDFENAYKYSGLRLELIKKIR